MITASDSAIPRQNIKTFRFFRFFNEGNYLFLTITLVMLTTLRSGIILARNLELYRNDSIAFPSISAYYKSSLIMPITTKLFGLSSSITWVCFYGFVTFLTFVSIALFVFRLRNSHNPRLLIALIFFSQLQVIMMTEMGKFDLFLILGAIILVFGYSLPVQLLGALSIAMGNFEQSIIVLGGLTLFSLSADNSLRFKRIATISSIALASQYVALNLAYGSWAAEDGDSRFNWLTANWFRFFKANIASLPTLIYSGYGACWILILIYLKRSSTAKNFIINVTCLIFIPLFITLTTFDGTRICVLISAPMLLVTLRSFSSLPSEYSTKFQFSAGHFICLALLTPAINVEMEGRIKIPYLHLWNVLST